MTDRIHKIADYYGLINQLMKTVEELNELALECAKSWEKKSITVNLIGEIADVEIMIEQLKYLGKIEQKDIDEVKEYKIARQLWRIKKAEEEIETPKLSIFKVMD